MGIAERKERERKEMRRLILDAAMKMFVKDGFEKTSIRNIAREIEYSPGSIYLHFKNKDEIFYALHAEFFNLLNARFDALQSIEDPLERLQSMGTAYMRFAFENPEAYNLMFVDNSPMGTIEDEDIWECAALTFKYLVDTVTDCVEKEYFPNKDVMQIVMISYGLAHGIVTLKLHRHMKMFPEEYHDHLLNDTMNYVIEMLRKG
ncbi:MAG: TetR/AcrR family transcriptional regulator [Bacteroidia bacterium]|nr:TetR/AcrR family transcriptional regulator [Bacteroidia bacterium]